LSTLGESLRAVSTRRRTEPHKLSALLRGDLDWIVMKALEKDRNRRYETASAFAGDIQRHLREEPIEARPPSAWYRFRKMVRRNKAAMTTAALVAAALVLGILGTTLGWVHALDAEVEALAAREEEAGQRRTADEQRDRALQAESAAKRSETKAAVNAALAREQALIADKQRQLALGEKQEADLERRKAEWLLYASNIAS